MLKKHQKWTWKEPQAKAFEKLKNLLTSDKVLTHFDLGLKLILACDASQYGLGAVLSHQMPDGSERPISFASRTLNATEKIILKKKRKA